MLTDKRVLIVGAGPIAGEYARICLALGFEPTIIGRGNISAQKFKDDFKLDVLTGGISAHVQLVNQFKKAIVATSEDTLDDVTSDLIELNVREILLEKPGSKSIDSFDKLKAKAIDKGSKVFLAYNRRFYQSVISLESKIIEDGGLKSMFFEFTEWGHVIKDIQKNPGVKENWLWHNSSHVIDLAFHIAGNPKKMSNFKEGQLDWHPDGEIFVGAGVTEKNILFSYHANWGGPGRWGLEFITEKNRYFLRPMEDLHIQPKGTVRIEKCELEDSLDKKWKPGFYLQTQSFLDSKFDKLMSLDEQSEKLWVYRQIIQG